MDRVVIPRSILLPLHLERSVKNLMNLRLSALVEFVCADDEKLFPRRGRDEEDGKQGERSKFEGMEAGGRSDVRRLVSVDLRSTRTREEEDDESEEVEIVGGEEGENGGVGGSSWWVSSLIVVNAAMGAGMLDFPFAFDEAGGLGTAMAVHVVVVMAALGSLLVLGWVADGVGEREKSEEEEEPIHRGPSQSYQETVERVCGRWVGLLCSATVALYMYLASITYLVVVGDQSDRIFHDWVGPEFCNDWYYNRKFIIAAGSIVLVWPLCYSKKIDFLKYASGAATIGIAYVVFIVVFVFASGKQRADDIRTHPDSWEDVFNVIPAVCFAYQCHVSSIPVYSCIRPRRLSSFTKTVSAAMAICFLSYSLIGILGYLSFGRSVRPDILSNYVTTFWPVALGFGLFALKNLLTFPIILFCGRLAINDLIRSLRRTDPEDAWERVRRVVLVTLWFVSALLVAVFLPNMTTVVDYLGCLAACFIFLFPGICLLQAATNTTSRKAFKLAGAAFFLIFGAFLFGLILTRAITSPKATKQQLCVSL